MLLSIIQKVVELSLFMMKAQLLVQKQKEILKVEQEIQLKQKVKKKSFLQKNLELKILVCFLTVKHTKSINGTWLKIVVWKKMLSIH